jgi:type VI secretion system secreted protein Hcp
MPTDIFMTIEDAEGNMLTEGASSEESIGAFNKESHVDQILVLAFEHDVVVPTDDRTGERTGNPRHRKMVITKLLDKSTPLLWAALAQNSSLHITIEFYRGANAASGGEPVHYYTIDLEGAKINQIETLSPDVMDNKNDGSMAHEKVAFTYNSITWEHVVCSTNATTKWSS